MGAPVSHIGGYGIPAIPTQPATAMFSHRFHRFHRSLLLRRNSHRFHGFTQIFTSTEFTEYTEQTGREYSPTDFTDLHRYLLPQNSRNTQNRLAENILPRISQIYTDIYSHRIHGIQTRLTENILPQISRIYTDIYSHRIHDLHGYLLPQNSRNTQNILLTSV